jgi:hypothetical protein
MRPQNSCAARIPGAADLKSLRDMPRIHLGDFRSKGGTGVMDLLVPVIFRSFVKVFAAIIAKLREAGTGHHNYMDARKVPWEPARRRRLAAENPRDSQGSLPKTASRTYLDEITAEL